MSLYATFAFGGLLSVSLLGFLPCSVNAQETAYPDRLRWLPEFVPRFEVESGSITASVVDAMGRVIVGGDFGATNGVPRNALARFRADLTLDESFVTSAFTREETASPDRLYAGSIEALAVQGDGKVLVGGWFDGVGTIARSELVRLHQDGSLDTDFVADAAVVALPGVPAELMVQSDGKILVRKDSSQLVRLLEDGRLDPTFAFASNLTDAASLSIQGMALHPDGHLWLIGSFRTDLGAEVRRLLRVNPDGSIDLATPEFDTDGREVIDIATDADGAIFVAGGFTVINGLAASHVVKLAADGTVDSAFSASSEVDRAVARIGVRPDGHVIVGFGGLGLPRVMSLNPDGSLDSSFVADALPESRWSLTEVLSDGRLILLGDAAAPWSGGSQAYRSHRLFVLDASGAAEGYLVADLRKSGEVSDAIPAGGGKWYAGGSWQFVNGAAAKPLVRLDSEGRVDDGFDPVLLPDLSTHVTKLARSPEGKLVAHNASFELAPVTRQDWDAQITQLDADGNQEVVFQPILDPAWVADLAFQPDGKLVASGSFHVYRYFSISLARLAISRMTSDGALDEAFEYYQPEEFHNRRDSGYSMQIQPDGRILLAGFFDGAFGDGSWNIVRVLEDGTPDPSFVLGEIPAEGHATLIRLQSDGTILAALEYPEEKGAVDQTHLVRLNANGSIDPTYAIGSGFNAPIADMLLQSDGKVLVGGAFTQFDGVDVLPIVRLNRDGTLDSAFALGSATADLPPIKRVSFIRIDESSRVLLGVETEDAPASWWDFPENRLLLFESAGRPLIVAQPTSQATLAGDRVTLSVDADSSEALSYQWRFNGADISGANQATLTLGAAQTFQAGNYSVVVSTAEGVVESDPALVTVVAAEASDARLINLSTRGFVGESGSILIPGLVIAGSGPQRLLIRAVGPSLEKLGVTDFLSDPKLTIYSGQTPILANDNWGENPEASATAEIAHSVGAFSLSADSKDAAFVVTLPPGLYTIHVQGVGGFTGIALAELYEVSGL